MAGIEHNNTPKIDLAALQKGFREYLEDKELFDPNSVGSVESASIFSNSEDFKNYLVEEVGLDASIFAQDVHEVLKGINDGSIFEGNEDALKNLEELQEDFEEEVEIEAEEIPSNEDGEIQDALDNAEVEAQDEVEVEDEAEDGAEVKAEPKKQTEKEKQVLNRLLDKVFEDEDVIKALDIDGDGKLSKKEKDKFKDFITGYSDDGEELTEADIKRAYNDILDGKFSYDDDLDEKQKEADKKAEVEASKPVSSSGGVSGGGGSYGGAGRASGTNSFSSSSADAQPKTLDNMTLEELEAEKATKEQAVADAQKEVDSINSGEKFKSEEENVQKLEDAYKEALEKDENKPPELLECLENIDTKEKEIQDTKTEISDLDSKVFEQKNVVSGLETTISSLKATQGELNSAQSDDPEKQAEIAQKKESIAQKISEVESQLNSQKEALTKLENDKKEKEELLQTKETELAELNSKKEQIEADNKDKLSEETQKAMDAYNEAKAALDEQKKAAESEAQNKLTTAQAELQKVNDKINEKKAAEVSKEYSVNNYDFDFNLKMSDGQMADMAKFEEVFKNNEDKYRAVEKATGVPAELIAAIHWRESGGNFNTYLHNGEQLGTVTKMVPRGVYFTDWTEAAIDAMQNYGGDISKIDKNDINTWYDYAERYNGLGYRNKGVMSPYVWAGTDKYTGGKYVADGVYDPNHYDQQLGVAAMLQRLLT